MFSLKIMSRLITAAAAVATLSSSALAAEGNLYNVDIESIAVINAAVGVGGHLAGNMEIKVRNGFALPPNVFCSQTYITTKKSADSDREMLRVLRDAKAQAKIINLTITDNPAYQAFQGRCSILSAQIVY